MLTAILAALPTLIVAITALVKAIRGDARKIPPPPQPPPSAAGAAAPSRITD